MEVDDVSKGDDALCSALRDYSMSLSWKASAKGVQDCKASGQTIGAQCQALQRKEPEMINLT